MSKYNNYGSIEIGKALIGCLGVVLAAVITGISLLLSVGVIQIGTSSLDSPPTSQLEPVESLPTSDNTGPSQSTSTLNSCSGNDWAKCWLVDNQNHTMT